jgi:hypothetical protein
MGLSTHWALPEDNSVFFNQRPQLINHTRITVVRGKIRLVLGSLISPIWLLSHFANSDDLGKRL